MQPPQLIRRVVGGIAWWEDSALAQGERVLVAFSERAGGMSGAPFDSLNLASHVGDDPDCVDKNRRRLLEVLGLGDARDRLTMSEQVHGESIVVIDSESAGSGASAIAGAPPVSSTDALVTGVRAVPLALCFADCVPVILVAPGPVVAVVHAGWRGALASLPGQAVARVVVEAGCESSQVRAYIGAHIGHCHYQVSAEIMSQFTNAFGTVARARTGGLDLDAVVTASLTSAGVDSCNIARLGICTAEATDRFFSYRASGGVTGRHAALACIL